MELSHLMRTRIAGRERTPQSGVGESGDKPADREGVEVDISESDGGFVIGAESIQDEFTVRTAVDIAVVERRILEAFIESIERIFDSGAAPFIGSANITGER